MHGSSDVGVILPFAIPLLCNIIEGIGTVRLPRNNVEFKALWMLVKTVPDEFILAKNGCATGITTSTISEVTDTSFTVKGRELGPVAFHGDSGALWIIIKSPGDLYNQIVLGVCSHINVTPEIIGESIVQTISCVNAPIWNWYDWFKEEILDKLLEATEMEIPESLCGDTVLSGDEDFLLGYDMSPESEDRDLTEGDPETKTV